MFYRPHSITVLRISVGAIFCWFGFLKLIPAASPAEQVAAAAMAKMTCGLIPAQISLTVLGGAETLIGLALVTGLLLRPALTLFYAHMAGVFTSLFLLPEVMWHHAAPTLEGQYVLKNLVLVAACLTVTADELDR
ncbi:DoxX family membrane protein [Streptomyces sp. NPDC023327]|uniref:DoxX family membrane protein n=1 Tax=Streptomyces sp. NPDC023327 TaxID=3157088 RepID=UPI0033CDBFAB